MLQNAFGKNEVIRRNKCITVKENTNRIQIDTVPTIEYRIYENSYSQNYFDGVVLYPDNNKSIQIINYPRQHLLFGNQYHEKTLRRYKRLTRILKNIYLRMSDNKCYSNKNITSFLLECLAFNIPECIYLKDNNCLWNNILKEAIEYILDNTDDVSDECDKWTEVSKILLLWHGHKWSKNDVTELMNNMWNYLEY